MTLRPTWITELLDNQRWLPCMFTTSRDRAQRQATKIRQALREAGKPWQGVVRVRRKSICVKVPAGVLMQKKPAQQFVPRNVVVKRMEPPPTPVAFGSLKKHPRPFSMLGGAR